MVELNQLTVLAGMNGAGKSSLVHALLLAKTAARRQIGTTISLNGIFGLELGTAEDVRNWQHVGEISIGLVSSHGLSTEWKLHAGTPESLFLTLESVDGPGITEFADLPRQFTYLSAERYGPRSVSIAQPVSPDEVEVGIHGEHTAQLISLLGNRPSPYPERAHPSLHDASLLKYEVERWLLQMTRAVEIDVETFADPAISRIRFRSAGGEWVRATNMGFGLSYALPIVVGGLVAAKDGLLIVENPEAHLHPQGQSNMGQFLAWLAGKGVQVIVETHSDHVLNGIRLAIGQDAFLSSDDASILYFEESEAGAPLSIKNLTISATGSVSDWPEGFFDQFQIDVAALGRLRRRS